MNNLAGAERSATDAQIRDELTAAGIDVVAVPFGGEVTASVSGSLRIGSHAFAFRRAWVYWIVSATPALTFDEAEYIDEWPRPKASGTKYSGGHGTLGDVVRCDGYSGGERPRNFPRPTTRGFDGWHIDTQAGLAGFVEALCALFGGAK